MLALVAGPADLSVNPVTAQYRSIGSPSQMYTATNCRVSSHTSMTCTTVPGFGSDFVWTVTVGALRSSGCCVGLCDCVVVGVAAVVWEWRCMVTSLALHEGCHVNDVMSCHVNDVMSCHVNDVI
jgi:hypothetical protein